MGINQITRKDVEDFKINVIGYAESVDPMGDAFAAYQTIATKSAIYPGQGTPLGLTYVALKMNGEAGEFAEHVGKAMRDDLLISITQDDRGNHCIYPDPTDLTPERRLLLIKEIGDVLWYLSAACNELGISLSEAAIVNLQKLCDRTERDALQGSGDER